ncbi:MAG: FAD-dependent oxidoreductase, partial [Pseudomonadota bacterium]
ARPDLRFAGQITGVEGYVESAAMGLLAGRMAVSEASGRDLPVPPQTTATGALLAHITGGAEATTFQPMNVNFGLFPPLDGVRSGRRGKRDRALGYTARAKQAWMGWLADAAPGQKVMADLP